MTDDWRTPEGLTMLDDDELSMLEQSCREVLDQADEDDDLDGMSAAQDDLDRVLDEIDARTLGGMAPRFSFGEAKELVRARYQPTWDWGTFELSEEGSTDATHWLLHVGPEEAAFDPAFDVLPGGPSILVDRQTGEISEVSIGLPGQPEFERVFAMRPVDASGHLLNAEAIAESEAREAWYVAHNEPLRLRLLGLPSDSLTRLERSGDEEEDGVVAWRPYSPGLATLVDALRRPAHVVDRQLGYPWYVQEADGFGLTLWWRCDQPEVVLGLDDYGLLMVGTAAVSWDGHRPVVRWEDALLQEPLADVSWERLRSTVSEAASRTRRTFQRCNDCTNWFHPGFMSAEGRCMGCAQQDGVVF